LFSPDGRRVLADYSADAAIVWDLSTGEPVKIIERDMGGIAAPEYYSFSNDGGRLLCRYKPATLWNLETGEVTVYGESQDVPELEGFVKPIWRSRFDHVVDRPATQEVLDRFKDRIPETARATEQTADGRRLIVYHEDGGIAVWDIKSGEPIYRCYQFRNGSRWLTVTPGGKSYGNLEFVRYRPSQRAH
jgi:WD40 repeat protein